MLVQGMVQVTLARERVEETVLERVEAMVLVMEGVEGTVMEREQD